MITQNQITEKRTDIILNYLQEKYFIEFCGEYGEKGYTNPEKGIIFADWNDISDNIQEYLELAGFGLEWSDEWTIDYNNNKAYRVTGNSYDWQCQVSYTDDGELLTPDNELQEWCEEFCITDENQPIKALNSEILSHYEDITSLGYILFNTPEYESGMHSGQNDDPSSIAKNCFDTIQEIDHIVFVVTETSQFYIKFNCYYKCI